MKGSLRCEKTDKRCEEVREVRESEDSVVWERTSDDIRGGHTRGELAGDARRRALMVEVIFIARYGRRITKKEKQYEVTRTY